MAKRQDETIEPTIPAAPIAAAPSARQSAAPECPYHPGTRCKSGHSDRYFTRYYCPVEGCTFSVKQQRARAAMRDEEEDFSAR